MDASWPQLYTPVRFSLAFLVCGAIHSDCPIERVETMGVYKQIDVAFQEAMITAVNGADKELADTVAWYREHAAKLPPELMRAILTDEAFFQKALTVWDNDLLTPKPASEHVALQGLRADLRKPKSNRLCVIGWSLILLALVAGVTVIVVAL